MLTYSCRWCMMCTVVGALFFFFPAAFIHAAKQIVSQTIVVDPSGWGGRFRTVQSAIDSVPSNNQAWTRIDIKAGTYREQVKIPRDKQFIYLKGEGDSNTFIVSNSLDAVAATFSSEADNTLAQDITFMNSYNIKNRNAMARAVAARIQGDKSGFYRCGFASLQDTLWDVGGRHYFKECSITGGVDFIYGAGQSIYEGCSISVVGDPNGPPGYITAQGRGTPQDTSGFVFKDCNIGGTRKCFLGRAWRPYARVVFYNTLMSDLIVPQGWDAWNNLESQLTMAEYNCSGAGSESSGRVKWEKKLSEREAQQFANISFIDDLGWVNQAFTILGAA